MSPSMSDMEEADTQPSLSYPPVYAAFHTILNVLADMC